MREVYDRRLINEDMFYLDWVGAGLLEEDWLQNRLNDTAARMLFNNSIYQCNYDTIIKQGLDPRVKLPELYHRINHVVSQGGWIIGHNLMDFDHRMLCEHLANFCKIREFPWAMRMFDTGSFEIARQLHIMPEPGEQISQWLWRARCARSRVKWALSRHCADVFSLWLRSGLDPLQAHDAAADTLLIYHLLEGFWELING